MRGEDRHDDSATGWQPTVELLDDLLEGFQVIDREWRYLYMNPAAARHGRTTPAAMIGRTMHECYPGFETTHIHDELARCMSTNAPILVETEFHFDDGTSGFFEVRAEPSGSSIVILSMDITERRRAEASARESEARRQHGERIEAIGLLSAGIAHDFNNLLGVMLGQGELTLARAGGPMAADVEIMVDAARRSAVLTRELLAFGRRQVMTPKVIDPREVVAGLMTLLRRTIGSDIELVFDTTREVGRIEIDPTKLEQVIVNLVINARDALPRGGRITLRLTEDHDSELDEAVVLSVVDDGVGMDEATRSRIFEPFFTTKERSVGTGLGLASVHGIVLQSGGAIRVVSEPGKGSAFHVSFPVAEDPLHHAPQPLVSVTSAALAEDAVPPARQGESVLVVEDHAQLRRLAEVVLSTAGYRVFTAATGHEALERVRGETSIALVVTDVIMPGMPGPELIERARALRPELRFLCTSGYAANHLEGQQSVPTDSAFLEKPYLPSVLLRVVRDLLDGSTP